MVHYDDSLTLRDARTKYFDDNHFGADGGYNDAWVQIRVVGIPCAFPNMQGRVRAVRFHDLHHVMTGYETTNLGEAEIGAWELATGCANHPAAWLLNLMAFGFGALRSPPRTLRALARGRRSQNLYRRTFDDALLDRTVGDVRAELGIHDRAVSPGVGDVAAFVGYALTAAVVATPLALTLPVMGVGMLVLQRFAPKATPHTA